VHGERPRPLHGGARFSESQQRLHGGTFVVDALFSGTTLDNGPNYLIDICLAEELVRRATAPLQQTHLITMTPRALGKLQRYLHFAVSLHGCSARSHISRVCT